MSKKETKNTEQKQEKVMTKYDLKVQKRQQEKEKAKKEQMKNTIWSVAIVVILAFWVVMAGTLADLINARIDSRLQLGGDAA